MLLGSLLCTYTPGQGTRILSFFLYYLICIYFRYPTRLRPSLETRYITRPGIASQATHQNTPRWSHHHAVPATHHKVPAQRSS